MLNSAVAALFTTPTPPALRVTGRPQCRTAADLASTATAALAGVSDEAAALVTSLAHCWHDHFEACHELCQSREGQQDADYVHAILHRREGDVDNARYWFRRVGTHPAFAELAAVAARHGLDDLVDQGRLDPMAFVAASVRPGTREDALVALQADEIRLFAGFLLR